METKIINVFFSDAIKEAKKMRPGYTIEVAIDFYRKHLLALISEERIVKSEKYKIYVAKYEAAAYVSGILSDIKSVQRRN